MQIFDIYQYDKLCNEIRSDMEHYLFEPAQGQAHVNTFSQLVENIGPKYGTSDSGILNIIFREVYWDFIKEGLIVITGSCLDSFCISPRCLLRYKELHSISNS